MTPPSRNLLLGLVAIASLAGLDLLGAYLAKEFTLRPRFFTVVLGLTTFGALFLVYIRSLEVADLWVVTFGWVVILEVGVLLLDRFKYGTAISPIKLVAAVAIVVLQVVLLFPESPDHTAQVVGHGSGT